MDAQVLQIARDSLSRCNQGSGFLDRFYELFIASSAEIREKFADTDFEKQRKVLSDSLFLMLSAAGTSGGFAHAQLSQLARKHDRNHLDIKPEWYQLWLDCLMQAAEESDPEFSPEVEAAWRASLEGGLELLSAAY